MKYILVIVSLLSCISFCASQAFEIEKQYVTASSLYMREKPAQASKILATLAYGEVVYFNQEGPEEGDHCDTIGSRFGCWYKVNYQNLVGYVFNAYLSPKYTLYHEDSQITYLPKILYWYGIYYDSITGIEFMKLIQPRMVESGVDDEGRKVKTLKTNQKSKSLFLIATFASLKEREMGVFTKFNRKTYKCSQGLKPGDIDWLFFTSDDNTPGSTTYQLITTGTYKLMDYGIQLSDYEIFVTDPYPPNPTKKIVQNLNQYFGYREVFTLNYIGDIDGDDKPDVIISGASNSGGAEILFLSSEAKENELLRPVAMIEGYDDC